MQSTNKTNNNLLTLGPNSIAKYNIEPGPGGVYRVNYVPVEVGFYDIRIQWNGREIEGRS